METEIKEGYKMTEVGVIPSDWELKELGSILTFGSGKDYKQLKNGEIPVYGTGGIMTYVDDFLYDGESVGVGRKGTIDRPILLNGKFWTVDTLFYTHQFQNSNPKFIYYKFCLIKWKDYNEASGVPSLNKNTLEKIKIPLPPLPEQTAIATALKDTDNLINSLETLIAKKKLIKQGAMHELLKPKDGWVKKKLGDVAKITMGQSPLSQYYNKSGIGLPLIQGNADIEKRRTIIRTYTSNITKSGNIGDIIMSVRAPVGEVSKAIFDCCLGRGVCAITFENDFLYHYLIFIENSWTKFSTGSTFDSVNSQQVKELEVILPFSDIEQIRIAFIVTEMDTELETLESKLSKYKKIKSGMMQQLLTGKIRLV